MKLHLLIIDPQKDFCDPQGSLYVPGADQDSVRLASFIDRMGDKIDEVHVTLDSHGEFDVAHPCYWRDSNGNHPDPFEVITVDDVESGKWVTTHLGLRDWGLKYVKALQANNKFDLCIWPPHCVIGKTIKVPFNDDTGAPIEHNGQELHADFTGYAITEPVSGALSRWSSKRLRRIDYVSKGSNPHTEHYSAVQADVTLDWDQTTMVNTPFLDYISSGDKIFLTGQALNYCVVNTARDIVRLVNDPDIIKKFVLLLDTMSNVPGTESVGDDFINEFEAQGAEIVRDSAAYTL